MKDTSGAVEGVKIRIEVAHARPEGQFLVALCLPVPVTASEAIARSGVLQRFPDIDLQHCAVGIHGRRCEAVAVLADGDRVEIYRPLALDAKERRRARAAAARRRRVKNEGP